jgi:hypothetical protein
MRKSVTIPSGLCSAGSINAAERSEYAAQQRQAVSVTMMNLLAAPGRHAHFRFDLGLGKGKKSH